MVEYLVRCEVGGSRGFAISDSVNEFVDVGLRGEPNEERAKVLLK